MRSGELKQTLIFKAKTVGKGAAGGGSVSYTDAVTTKGKVQTLSGAKVEAQDERLYIDQKTILVRKNYLIKTDMRLELDGFLYEVIDIIPDNNFRFLRIKVERVDE